LAVVWNQGISPAITGCSSARLINAASNNKQRRLLRIDLSFFITRYSPFFPIEVVAKDRVSVDSPAQLRSGESPETLGFASGATASNQSAFSRFLT
jgi:hypothetical protein